MKIAKLTVFAPLAVPAGDDPSAEPHDPLGAFTILDPFDTEHPAAEFARDFERAIDPSVSRSARMG